METLTLDAVKREEVGRKNYAARLEGKVPAIVYGSEIQPQSIAIDETAFGRVLKQAGESTIIDLMIDGKPIKVLIQDVQRDPLSSAVIHADFRQVNMSKPIEAGISLKFVGDSAAVHALGGTLVKSLEEIEVRCLPSKLVHELEVDVSVLKTFDDAIKVKDIVVPEGMEVLTDAEFTVATIEAPRSEEELAALNEKVDVDVTQIEVEKKGKDEAAEAEAEAKAKA